MKGKSRISINDWSVASAYTGCWRQFWPSKFLKLVPKPYILKEIRIHCCFLFCFWKPIHRRTLIWGHRFPPNNKRMNSTLLQWDLSSFVIWRKSTTPKKHFEIKWPLRHADGRSHLFPSHPIIFSDLTSCASFWCSLTVPL